MNDEDDSETMSANGDSVDKRASHKADCRPINGQNVRELEKPNVSFSGQ